MRKVILSLAGVLAITAIAPEAFAIPSFSRQASMTCKACHFQHVPVLNGFGQAFKSGGYPMMGATQGKVEGEGLSIPDTLNASMALKARYQKTYGANTDVIPGDSTNSGQWQVPDEFNLFFGGRIAETVGFYFEAHVSAPRLDATFKLPAAVYVADAKFSVIPFMGDEQGASYGFEQSSTGAVRNIRWAEHRKEISAQQYVGTDSPATGVAIVAQNDTGYINLTRWAPAFMAQKGAAQTLRSTYLRIAATPTVSTSARGDWALQFGAQFWRGTNYAVDSLLVSGLIPVDTRATAFDFQAFGQVAEKDLGIYVTWAKAPGGTAAQPNILNAGDSGGRREPSMYRANERSAWTIGAEYSVIQSKLHIGAAYRRANTGGAADTALTPAIVGDSTTDNSITLTAVYNLTQNIEFHLNHSIYNATQYKTDQTSNLNLGKQLTTFMLQTAW